MKRFITAVENLIPKKSSDKSSKPRVKLGNTSAKESKSGNESKTDNASTVTVDDLRVRFRKWVQAEIQKQNKEIAVDVAVKHLDITSTENDGVFSAKCKQPGCSKMFVLRAVGTTCNMGNVYRHLTKSCWLSKACNGLATETPKEPSQQSAITMSFFNPSKSKVVAKRLQNETITLDDDESHSNQSINNASIDFTASEPDGKKSKLDEDNPAILVKEMESESAIVTIPSAPKN